MSGRGSVVCVLSCRLMAVCLVLILSPFALSGAGVEVVIHVSATDAAANDSGAGTVDEPLRTLAAAAQRALPVLRDGGSVTIELAGGVYRGGADFTIDGQRRGALTIRSADGLPVVVRGSRIVSGWRVEGDFFVRQFNDLPAAELESVVLDEPLIFFVQDVRVMRASALTGMRHGVFRVDRERGRVSLLPPQNAPLLPTNVEMALPIDRPLLRVSGLERFECSDVTIERLGGGRGAEPGLAVKNVGTVELIDVAVQWNGWGGGWFEDIDQLTLLRLNASHNGGYGLNLRSIGELRAVSCNFVLNNWRGAESGGWMDSSTAGFRAETVGQTLISRCRFNDNHANGVLIDSSLGDVLIERTTIAGNQGDGLNAVVRAFKGDEVRAVLNKGVGVSLEVLVRAAWEYGMIYGNSGGAMVLNGSGATVWSMRNSITVGSDGPAVQINTLMPGDWAGSRNLYYRTDGSAKPFELGGQLLSLDQWTRQTGSDQISRFADPRLDRADEFNFSLAPDSPWHRHMQWQPR